MSSTASPFVSTPHGHPSFNPAKVGIRNSLVNESRSAKPKPPEKQPLIPYMRHGRKSLQTPQKQQEGKITLQSTEEEEESDEFSQKHVASARYIRNHRLINEIFSDTLVPDVRSVVMVPRLQVLKKQVQSLTMHQKKLESELAQIEDRFGSKKRKFIDSSDAFQEEIKKRCAIKPVDAVTYQKMLDKALDELKKQHEKQLAEEKAAAIARIKQEEEEERKNAALNAIAQEKQQQQQQAQQQQQQQQQQPHQQIQQLQPQLQPPIQQSQLPQPLETSQPSLQHQEQPLVQLATHQVEQQQEQPVQILEEQPVQQHHPEPQQQPLQPETRNVTITCRPENSSGQEITSNSTTCELPFDEKNQVSPSSQTTPLLTSIHSEQALQSPNEVNQVDELKKQDEKQLAEEKAAAMVRIQEEEEKKNTSSSKIAQEQQQEQLQPQQQPKVQEGKGEEQSGPEQVVHHQPEMVSATIAGTGENVGSPAITGNSTTCELASHEKSEEATSALAQSGTVLASIQGSEQKPQLEPALGEVSQLESQSTPADAVNTQMQQLPSASPPPPPTQQQQPPPPPPPPSDSGINPIGASNDSGSAMASEAVTESTDPSPADVKSPTSENQGQEEKV